MPYGGMYDTNSNSPKYKDTGLVGGTSQVLVQQGNWNQLPTKKENSKRNFKMTELEATSLQQQISYKLTAPMEFFLKLKQQNYKLGKQMGNTLLPATQLQNKLS